MKLVAAALGSAVWFALAPGVVAGLVPWLLTGWEVRPIGFAEIPIRTAGGVLVVLGGGVLVHAFARFAVEGLGTPHPAAPTERLVVGGLYRYVRNPMYLAIVASVVGQALLLGRFGLLWYALVVAVITALFVHGYEEPTLSRRFGAEYDKYRRAVPRWVPRPRPWRP